MAVESFHNDYPYLNNCHTDHRLLGFPAFNNPFIDNTSASRGDMYSSHITQAMVVKNAEFPYLFSGYESNIGDYESNSSQRDEDVRIIKVIPKYRPMAGMDGFGRNQIPKITVICYNLESKAIDYFDIERYFAGADGFGHENKWLKVFDLVQEGNTIGKEVKLVTSPAHKGLQYNLGVNANVLYMTDHTTIEDAFWIDTTLADKMHTTGIYKIPINIRPDSRPINLYGDDTTVQFVPNIGQRVASPNNEGVLCAFRPYNVLSYAADSSHEMMSVVQENRDLVYKVEHNATVIDIDFVVNKARKSSGFSTYSQVAQYQENIQRYWLDIYETYQQLLKQNRNTKFTEKFLTKVNEAITNLYIMDVPLRIPGLNPKAKPEIEGHYNQTVEFIQMVVTYKVDRPVGHGSKSSDRGGAKGVVCKVSPPEDMPVDDFGVRANIVIAPGSVGARMNLGQLFEQAINRISEFVRRRCAEIMKTDPLKAYTTMLEWYADVNQNYANLVLAQHPTDRDKLSHIKFVCENFPHIHVPAGLVTLTDENVLAWAKKWDVPVRSPVEFNVTGLDGTKRRIRTHKAMTIGSKYIMCLSKIPHIKSPGIARVNQNSIPIKPSRDGKYSSPVSMSPIRLGEDEVRMQMMDMPVREVVRQQLLNGNSPKGVNLLVETILMSKTPTNIDRIGISDQELSDSNAVANVLHHTSSVMGIDTRRTKTTAVLDGTITLDDDILTMDPSISSDLYDLQNPDDDGVLEPTSGDDTDPPSVSGVEKDAVIDTAEADPKLDEVADPDPVGEEMLIESEPTALDADATDDDTDGDDTNDDEDEKS